MKISELQKKQTGTVAGLGKVEIVGLAKTYITVKQIEFNGIKCKMWFKSNSEDISILGLTLDEA